VDWSVLYSPNYLPPLYASIRAHLFAWVQILWICDFLSSHFPFSSLLILVGSTCKDSNWGETSTGFVRCTHYWWLVLDPRYHRNLLYCCLQWLSFSIAES
jgi:hypothetical protein